ncbi:MAG TPA: porin [Caulobacteraceae bacterium]|nr:porin [Caulobacteraceae bacterium]
MKKGKMASMSGVAVIAMVSAAQAAGAGDLNGADKPLVLAQNASPSNSNISNAELASRIQALEDQLANQQERAMADRTRLSTLEQGYNSALWNFDNGRASFASGDGRFTLAIRARMQADFAGFSQDAPGSHPAGFAGPTDLSSGAVMRRAYFGIEGKAYNDFWYELRLNAGGSDGGLNSACTSTTTITAPPGGAATSTCAIGSIANSGEGDPLLNKMVITYVGIPWWHFNVGVIEPSFMMEGTTSSANLIWMERPDLENIAADSFGAGDSRRGIEIGWSRPDTLWAGDNTDFDVAFTGGKTGSAAGHGNGGDEQAQILARVTDRLWSDGISNFQVGMSIASVLYSGNSAGGGAQALRFRERPEIRVDGTRLIDTGNIAAKTGDMIAFDAEGNWQNFYLEGEWAQFKMDRQCGGLAVTAQPICTTSTAVIDHPTFTGWTVGGTWILTGETKPYTAGTYIASAVAETQAGYGAPIPSRPFSLDGNSWGTWELTARYSDTDLNWHGAQLATTSQLAGINGGRQRIMAFGVNWYLNRNVRMILDDNIVQISKGTAALPDRDSQDFNVVGLRIQYAN